LDPKPKWTLGNPKIRISRINNKGGDFMDKCMLAQAGDEGQIDKMIASGNYHWEVKYDGERCTIEVYQARGSDPKQTKFY